jgi:serine phosphatase RsbU (regulator of sigma subunit)
VAYTDGITDARSAGEDRFGFRRLNDTLELLGAGPAGDMMEGLTRELERFQAGAQTDDTAAIALHRLGAREMHEGDGKPENNEVLREGTITRQP